MTGYKVTSDMILRGFTTVRDLGGADRGLQLAVEEGHFTAPVLDGDLHGRGRLGCGAVDDPGVLDQKGSHLGRPFGGQISAGARVWAMRDMSDMSPRL